MSLNEEFLNKISKLDQEKAQEKKLILDLKDDIQSLALKLEGLSGFKLRLAQDDADTLKNGLITSKSILNQVNSLEIPKEIIVKHKNVVEFRELTRTVLVVFFMVSVLVVGGSIWWVNKRTAEATALEEKVKHDLEMNYTQQEVNWMNTYFNHMNKRHPRDTKDFIKENPIPTGEN